MTKEDEKERIDGLVETSKKFRVRFQVGVGRRGRVSTCFIEEWYVTGVCGVGPKKNITTSASPKIGEHHLTSTIVNKIKYLLQISNILSIPYLIQIFNSQITTRTTKCGH